METKDMTPFQRFLHQEMHKRDMSQRAFASYLGVNQTTVSSHLQFQGKPPEPSIEFLVKVAQKTGVSLPTLLGMVYPDLPSELFVDMKPDVRLIAERIANLPPEQRDIIDRFILSLTQ